MGAERGEWEVPQSILDEWTKRFNWQFNEADEFKWIKEVYIDGDKSVSIETFRDTVIAIPVSQWALIKQYNKTPFIVSSNHTWSIDSNSKLVCASKDVTLAIRYFENDNTKWLEVLLDDNERDAVFIFNEPLIDHVYKNSEWLLDNVDSIYWYLVGSNAFDDYIIAV